MNESFIIDIVNDFRVLVYNKNSSVFETNYRINHEFIRVMVFSSTHVIFGATKESQYYTITFPLTEDRSDETYKNTRKILYDVFNHTEKFPPTNFQIDQERRALVDSFLTDLGLTKLKSADWYPSLFFSRNKKVDLFCSRSGIEVLFNKDTISKRVDLSLPIKEPNLEPYAKLLNQVLDKYQLC